MYIRAISFVYKNPFRTQLHREHFRGIMEYFCKQAHHLHLILGSAYLGTSYIPLPSLEIAPQKELMLRIWHYPTLSTRLR